MASPTTTLASGSFNIQVGSGTAVPITIGSNNNTLKTLASSINSLSAGVTATVIQDANGARLALTSNATGAPGDLTVSANTSAFAFTKAVTGTNASLTVDGVPISSATNSVSNVINGVTLNLASPSPTTPVTLNISPDTTQASSAINTFVSAYNAVISDINSQFAVASDGSGGGPLLADNSLQDAQGQILSTVASSVAGNNGIVNLASIGLDLNNDGTLSVNSSKLSTALSGNYTAVQNLLQNSSTGIAQNFVKTIGNLTSAGTGVLALDQQGIQTTSQGITQQISDLQSSLLVQQQSLTAVYAQVNATLQELPLLQNQISQQLSGLK